jgi:subtilisin family serine protease
MQRRLLALIVPLLALVVLAGPAGASCDPGYDRQWGLTQVGGPQGWSKSTGAGVKIGIVDTGVDLNHEDLKNKVVAGTKCDGTNGSQSQCTGKLSDAQDDYGHGTHVAGIAAAYKDNGIGVAGVAPDAQLVVAKVLYPDGSNASGSINDINAGVKWVVDHGARVVNLSLGSDLSLVGGIFGDNSLADGIDYAWSHGAVPVLASGNSNFLGFGSSNYGDTPAIVVAAVGKSGQVASYSSPVGDAKYAVSAPGGDGDCTIKPPEANPCVFSTYWQAGSAGNVYGWLEGTSMATPFVAGAVADLLAQGLSPTAARDRVLSTASPVSGCGASDCGRGRLNVAAAVGGVAAPPSACPAGGTGTTVKPSSGGSGTKTTTKTTVKKSGGGTGTTGTGSVTTVPDTGETTTTVGTDDSSNDDQLQAAGAAPPDTSGRSADDDGASGPLTVAAALGVLGAGATVAPIAWRRFVRPG